MLGHPDQFDRFVSEVVPLLQEAGVFRGDYEGATLRDHLGLPKPANLRVAAQVPREAALTA
jgi:hypothetical protein